MPIYAVRRRRGGPWDFSRDLREQAGWDEHAALMDEMVDDGFIQLGGPLEGDHDVLLVIEAASEAAVHERLAGDPWTASGMLRTTRVEAWTVLLDGRAPRPPVAG